MTAPLKTTPLTPRFGVEITNVDLREVTADHSFPQIRSAFEHHSVLLFRNQNMDDETHKRVARLFGPLENREADDLKEDGSFEVPEVSNVTTDGGVTGEFDDHTLNLKANMLWHTDSTFLPIPALINIITARIVPSEGGATQLASTRAAFRDMPDTMKAQLRNANVWHHLSKSRERIMPELAAHPMFHKWPQQCWKALWPNPVTHEEAVYIASHAYKVEGMSASEGRAFIDDVIAFCTQPEYVYSHEWCVDDVLIWDERATLHRGTPWPYEQPRLLSSICVSAGEADGSAAVRVETRQ